MILGSAPEAGFHYEAEPMEFGNARPAISFARARVLPTELWIYGP